ncbi:MAG: RNA-binding protein [Nanoarchaeota archaeon]
MVNVKVFVGNLPLSYTDKEFKQLFSSLKPVTASLVMNEKTHRPKEFGFVTFSSKEAADKAISQMNGKEVYGRKITLKEYIVKEEPGRRS